MALSRLIGTLPDKQFHFIELSNKVTNYQNTFDLLNTSYQNMLITKEASVPNAQVITDAIPDFIPVFPEIPQSVALCVLLGLVGAIMVAGILEMLDTTIHSEETIQHFSSRPILAYMPKVQGAPRLSETGEGHFAILENSRLLRSNLLFTSLNHPPRIIMVTSPGAGEGKSSIACNLAVVLAMDGKKVVIIDADLRRPAIHRYYDLPSEQGLTSVVIGMVPLEAAQQRVQENLQALT